MAPLGTAVLGHRAGDVFPCDVLEFPKCWRVAEVIYQPETESRYHL
jgi:hypothetical protein